MCIITCISCEQTYVVIASTPQPISVVPNVNGESDELLETAEKGK